MRKRGWIQGVGWGLVGCGVILLLPIILFFASDPSAAVHSHPSIASTIAGIASLVLARFAFFVHDNAATLPRVGSSRAAPPPREPSPAAPDVSESELVNALRARPDDTATRMVYADFLEQSGELARANYVRAATGVRGEQGDNHISRGDIVEILAKSDVSWRAAVCRERATCQRGDCPGSWDAFAPRSDDPLRRDCHTCAKDVRYCTDLADVTETVMVVDLAASALRVGESAALEDAVVRALASPR